MNYFNFKEPRVEDGRKILEFGILSEKHCTFDCIYSPISRKEPHHRGGAIVAMPDVTDSLAELDRRIDAARPDLLFINSKGEALYSDKLPQVLDHIRGLGLPVRLLSNGAPYGDPAFAALARRCDEVIGKLKSGNEATFQRVQRPVPGCTLENCIAGMAAFRTSYAGTFILEITVMKRYSESSAALALFAGAVRRIRPDVLRVITNEDAPFAATLAVSSDFLAECEARLRRELKK